MLICVTPPAMTPGMPSATRRRTPSLMRGHLSRSHMPLRRTPSSSSHSCRRPAANMPQACTTPASGSFREPSASAISIAAIMRQVEHDRDGRALDELAERVEHARQQRHQRHAQQVGHGDPRQQHGEIELLRVGAKPGASPYISERHGDLGDDGDASRITNTQAGHRLLGERARGLLALALEPLGEQRHEGRVEGALAEQPAEQIGEAEGDEEGVRDRARCPASPRSECRARSRARG